MILGINAYHGDVAVALLRDGDVVAALEEERYVRCKHVAGLPKLALRDLVKIAAIDPVSIETFAISRRPSAHLIRKMAFTLAKRPRAVILRDRISNALKAMSVSSEIAEALNIEASRVKPHLQHVEHHDAHLASTFFVSPFERAAVCSIDGFGDFVSTAVALGDQNRLTRLGNVYFPHSLGILYLALTQYLGFPKYGDEYKVMGLAPYGRPDFASQMRTLVRLERGGGFKLDLSYFRHWSDGVSMTWAAGEPAMADVFTQKLEMLLGPRRHVDEALEPRHEAIAASIQVVFEEAAFHVLNEVYKRTKSKRLCLAGGCAMNSVMNGKIRQRTPFEEVYIQPAAADNGTALGAALYVAHQLQGRRRSLVMQHAYWGPGLSDSEIEHTLDRHANELEKCDRQRIADFESLCDWTAMQIASGKVVGWVQGRMEWGPRALGNRSILGDPRRTDMRDIINTRIKFRERFRPFAPSVLEEALDEYFVGAVPDPFMIQVYPVRPEKRSMIPAVTHVDGSGRLQTVSRRSNQKYWTLIKSFEAITGVPVLLNTSFNENEPIVNTPDQALACFLRTDMDVLIIGSHILAKTVGSGVRPSPEAAVAMVS